ncbi:hypothetical protein P691DRAFT_348922 [Macrolepiota fuliginosa MF-IS2]|uniref:Phosphatidylglycerol/phosphatidylinositol transfer protein n=1 Tax=Macrolepiota fuliginosa MF-IS2 TaxID=1400762 RepID=A0A9P5X634_9AGAR|nr:hypothetical protein P691DRAFT_348922 [Macrolepiota fuliginosa MF-IS2]
MKFTSALLPILALITTATAQRSYIRNPTNGTSVAKGTPVVVQLVRPNSIQGSTEVGIALSFQSCPSSPCPPAEQQLGSILFVGQYNPQLHEIPGNPYQNFTVTIPDFDFGPGRAEIISTRFHLIGAGPSPVLETNVVEVNLTN